MFLPRREKATHPGSLSCGRREAGRYKPTQNPRELRDSPCFLGFDGCFAVVKCVSSGCERRNSTGFFLHRSNSSCPTSFASSRHCLLTEDLSVPERDASRWAEPPDVVTAALPSRHRYDASRLEKLAHVTEILPVI